MGRSKDTHAIGQQAGQLTGGQGGLDDHFGAQPADGQNTGIDRGKHQRHGIDGLGLGFDENVVDVLAGFIEF